ncbi:MAG TPA: hypothetical protein VFC38_03700 [Stellaceae bacterium]|nr:hypothetical protein [Stellaceae bacterium]
MQLNKRTIVLAVMSVIATAALAGCGGAPVNSTPRAINSDVSAVNATGPTSSNIGMARDLTPTFSIPLRETSE